MTNRATGNEYEGECRVCGLKLGFFASFLLLFLCRVITGARSSQRVRAPTPPTDAHRPGTTLPIMSARDYKLRFLSCLQGTVTLQCFYQELCGIHQYVNMLYIRALYQYQCCFGVVLRSALLNRPRRPMSSR